MKTKRKIKRIALGFPSGIAFVERILQGVVDYARKHGGWSFVRIPERLDPSLDWLKGWDGDGALIVITSDQAVKMARSLPMPAVNLSAYIKVPDLPTVMVDQKEVGRMAARHLLERRFSRFGYYGTSDLLYSQLRHAGFVETIEAAGGECRILEVPSVFDKREKWTWRQEKLEHWLRTLRPPVGIMASTDLRACMVVDACARLGLRIPEDVALIGVDNDPVCEFCDPPLSSVSRNNTLVGLHAAALLDRLMRGHPSPAEPILISPDQVICRHSTDTFAIEDPRIAEAVKYIQQNVHRPFGVERLLDVVSMPRRTFEQYFLKNLGMTAYAFISRQRIEHARVLLAEPKKRSLTEIAFLSGFNDLRRFRLVFRRLMGINPAFYQRKIASGRDLNGRNGSRQSGLKIRPSSLKKKSGTTPVSKNKKR